MFHVFDGVVRTQPIPDGHVSISPRGSIALAANLGRADLKHHFCEFAYDDEARQVRLRLTRQAGTNGYCWRLDKSRWRVEPLAAMKHYQLRPAVRTFCSAKWLDGAMYIQLPTEQSAAAQAGPAEEPKATESSKYAVKWAGRIECPDCGKTAAYRWVGGKAWMRKHNRPLGGDCGVGILPEGYVKPETPVTTGEPPLTTQDLPAVDDEYCICAVCRGRFNATMRSGDWRPYAHRVDGKICPGVFQSPLPDDGEQ